MTTKIDFLFFSFNLCVLHKTICFVCNTSMLAVKNEFCFYGNIEIMEVIQELHFIDQKCIGKMCAVFLSPMLFDLKDLLCS